MKSRYWRGLPGRAGWGDRGAPGRALRAGRHACLPGLDELEARITPSANLAISDIAVVDQNAQPLSTINVGEWVYIKVDFTAQDLPGNASYRIAFTVNGLTKDTGYVTWGAGASGTNSEWGYWGTFLACPGTNQFSVTLDPDQSVAESSYADNSLSSSFDAVPPATSGYMSYSVAQIRSAYGINSIPAFGTTPADGTGQTIALVEAGNEPTILSDLDSFDQAMSVSLSSSESIYQQYGAASSFANVYNQSGANITADIASSGSNGVPAEDPTGHWEGEETLDVEWAHAIAPGARIDIIEVNDDSNWPTNLLIGEKLAASLPGVTSISNSFGLTEWSGETSYDSSTFVTPANHPGVTFLTASNDNGAAVYPSPPSNPAPGVGNNGYYPATSPNVVSVGGTQLALQNDGYGSETAWSFPSPADTTNYGGPGFLPTGSWASQSGGFSGTVGVAAGGSSALGSWTIPITATNTGWGTEVSATWVPVAGAATNATYTVYDGTPASGTILGTVTVDQSKAPAGTSDGGSQFQELGVFFPTLSSSGDGTLTVVLNAATANGQVVADAVGAAQAWASTGGPTPFESEPAYQKPFQNTGYRVTPDVSFDASQNSGVDLDFRGNMGNGAFGTSLSSPCWAGLIAIVNQGRVYYGGTSLNSPADPTQTLEALYSLPASDFHDITTGYNGYSAGTGYDFVTGRGSPIANLLVPDLVSYGLATKLAVTTAPPSSTTAGAIFSLKVSAETSLGTVVTGYSGSLTIALSAGPNGASLGGTLTQPVVDGVATFSDVVLDQAGSGYQLRITGGNLTPATTGSIRVTPAAAYQLAVTTQPSTTATAGQAFAVQPVVAEEDRFGNVVTGDSSSQVSATLATGVGPLQGTVTANFVRGIATFTNLADNTAETISLEFTSGNLQGHSDSIVVAPGPVAALVLDLAPPSTAVAGQAFTAQPVIYEEDRYGNVLTGDNRTVVTAAIGQGAGPLLGTAQATVLGGIATFSDLADTTAGTITLSFSIPVAGVQAVTSGAIAIRPAAASKLVLDQGPTDVTAGSAISPAVTVEVEDQYGNVVTGDTSSVTLTLNGGTFEGGGSTATAVVASGVATFGNLKIDAAGSDSLTASDTEVTSTITSGSFKVRPAAVSRLVVQTQPSMTATAGVAFAVQPVVAEEDRYGNVVTGDNTTVVTAAIGHGAGPLQGTAQATVSGGVATFAGLSDTAAGTITLSFSIPAAGVAPVTSGSITISPASASQLAFTQQPNDAVAGSAISPSVGVAVEDPYGNVVTSDGSTVTLSLSPGTFAGGSSTISATANAGVATFTGLIIDATGNYTLAMSDGSLRPQGTGTSFKVTPAAASRLAFAQQPTNVTAGSAINPAPSVQVLDAFGNVVTGDTSTITLTLNGGTFADGSSMATAAASSGVATFPSLVVDAAGSDTITATDGTLQSSGASGSFTVAPATANHLAFQIQPSTTAVAGRPFATPPVIVEEDRYGNIEIGDFSTAITASFVGSDGTPQGSATAIVNDGIASFAGLADNTAGTATIWFTAANLPAITSGAIAVSPAAAIALTISASPPSSVTAGVGFGLKVAAVDPFGNIVSTTSDTVTLALDGGPEGSALGGPFTADLVNGIATFTGLTLDKAAADYRISAAASGLASATTDAFTVDAGPPARLVILTQPGPDVTAGSGFGLTVEAQDALGNVATLDHGNVVVTITGGSPGLDGTTTEPLIDGVATFTGLTLSGTGGYTLSISSGGLSTSVAGTVTPGPTTTSTPSPTPTTTPAGTPPTIIGEQILTTGKGKHRHAIGLELRFSAAIDPARAQNPGNYTLTETLKHRKKQIAHAVAIRALYDEATDSVSLMFVGQAPFKQGGQLVVNASPSTGIAGASGTALDGNNEGLPGDNGMFVVLPKARGIIR